MIGDPQKGARDRYVKQPRQIDGSVEETWRPIS